MRLFDRYPELRRVMVNCKTESVFQGVLWRRRRDRATDHPPAKAEAVCEKE